MGTREMDIDQNLYERRLGIKALDKLQGIPWPENSLGGRPGLLLLVFKAVAGLVSGAQGNAGLRYLLSFPSWQVSPLHTKLILSSLPSVISAHWQATPGRAASLPHSGAQRQCGRWGSGPAGA